MQFSANHQSPEIKEIDAGADDPLPLIRAWEYDVE